MMQLWRPRSREPRASLLDRLRHGQDGLAALLLDDAGGPALVIDASGRIVRCNEAMRTLLPAEALVRDARIERVFAIAARPLAWGRIEQALKGHALRPIEFAAALDLPAEPKDIRVALCPIREATGCISGALLRFADLTAQRALEAQLAHSQKLQATGQLAGGIAHDFNNLLTAILGAAEGIIEREQPLRANGQDTVDDARQICDSAQRGAALVRQLLAFGRQQTLLPRALAVNDVIASISGLLQRLLGGKVRLVAELEQPGRRVMADPTQLDQVLVNLVVNARDAMPDGGAITLRSGHLTVYAPQPAGAETMPPGRYVTIEVQDAGTGIPPAVLPHIFDPFFTTKRDAGGSGLGLSSVHGIIRQSGGFLTVDTKPGVGTCMRIFLPRWDGPEPDPEPAPTPAPTPGPAKAVDAYRGIVLLADDEAPVRRLAQRALMRAGWQVIEADSGESALESLHARPESAPPVTALISDMVMPGISGIELAIATRAFCKHPLLPVVFVSGYAESPVRGGLAQPGTVYLAKPYRLADLIETLDRVTQTVV